MDCWCGRQLCWVGIGPCSAESWPRSGAGVVPGDLDPRWGYMRIRGELIKLGHVVPATSSRNLQQHGVPTSSRRSRLSWREVLRAQASAIVATDYFTVDTWSLKRLHVFFFIEVGTWRILWFGVTENPNQEWVSQHARNLTWQLQEQGSQAST